MLSQMRQLQELSRVHGRVYVFLFMRHDWELLCDESEASRCSLERNFRISFMVSSEHNYYTMIFVLAVSSIARNPLRPTLQKLKHQPRNKPLDMKCVLAVPEEKTIVKHMYTQNDDGGASHVAACMWLRSKYKPGPTVREAEAEAPEKRKQLQTRHVYGFDDSDIFLYSFFQQKARVFLGPVDPQTLGRKELLLDFYFIQFLKISYPVPFCEFLGLLCEHVRICPWRLVKMDYDTVTCVGEVSTNSTWAFDFQAHALEDVAETRAPAEEEAAADEMCLGFSWVLQEDKCQASDNAWECQAVAAWNMLKLKPWKHWLRMAAIPEGSWSRFLANATCWGSCKSYQESTEEFMFFYLSWGMIEKLHCDESEAIRCSLEWDFQQKLHGIPWTWIIIQWFLCWWNRN